MGRMHNGTGNSNKSSLPQTPKNLKITDGNDVEYSAEFADHADLEALARANAANQRVKTKRNK
ncbi:YfhD-like protein [Bacillus sp. OV166]|uniref:YfhD family protein n=1 Tax=Bacillus sp. OV166 TaxID=1882763 RepID=UPI000A2ADD45|nr:YfhD family protein [Bacillus sp. OV166]SMQ65851.1 YfhD-like protein [Bacillus sp. OV166]